MANEFGKDMSNLNLELDNYDPNEGEVFNVEATGTEVAATSGKKAKGKAKPKYQPATVEDFRRMGVQEAAFVSRNSPRGKLREYNSRVSQVCGFVTPFNSRQDIVLKKKTNAAGAAVYDFGITERMSKTIEGVIVKHYPDFDRAILSNSPQAQEGTVMIYQDGTDTYLDLVKNNIESGVWLPVYDVMSYSDFVDYVSEHCWEDIAEAAAIFTPFTITKTKGKGDEKVVTQIPIDSPEKLDRAPVYSIIDNRKKFIDDLQAASMDQKKTDSIRKKMQKKAVVFQLTRNYRGKEILAPHNYIPANKYETINVAERLTAEEATLLNKIYIAPLFVAKNVDNGKYDALSEQSSGLATKNQSPEGAYYTSAFFKADADSVLTQTAFEAKRWFNKKEKLEAGEVSIVKKEYVEGRKSPTIRSNPYGTSYSFDPQGEHKAIAEATDGALSASALESFMMKIAKKPKGAKVAKTAQRVYADVQVSAKYFENYINSFAKAN